MPLVSPFVRFWNLITDQLYAQSAPGDIVAWQWDRTLDAPSRLRLELDLASAVAAAVITATGGPSLAQPPIPLLGEFSQDGGASVDVRFVLVSAQRSLDPAAPLLIIEQDDLYSLYGVTGVDRVTFVNAKPADVTDGAAGAVPRPPGSIGGTKPWPYVKGLFRTVPGLGLWKGQHRLAMTPVLTGLFLTLPLSIDLWADTIQNSLKVIAGRLAGTYFPGDSAPYGARGHAVPHTGDAARNPTGQAMAVAVGLVGAAPALTFDGDGGTPVDETTTVRLSGAQLAVQPLLADLYTQASFLGGASNHGLATGIATSGAEATRLTALLCINTGRGGASTRWDDSLPIVGTTAGVYYHVCGSGFLVAHSQPFVVNALAYDPTTKRGVLYAASPDGVFTHAAQPKAPPVPKSIADTIPSSGDVWPRLGGLAAPVEDVWLDPTTSPPTVLARCGGSTKKNGVGVDGIYAYPALAGDTRGTGQGYDGWSRVEHSGAPLAAGGTLAALYYTDRNKPGTVYLLVPGTSARPQAVVGIKSGQTIVGIDTGVNLDGSSNGYVYLRTSAGQGGLYAVALGSTVAVDLNADGSLKSADGTPVQVTRVLAYGADIRGEHVALLAATDAGLFRSPNKAGGKWASPNAVSGLGDFTLAFVAAGGPQTILGQQTWRLFCGDARSFLISHNAGDNWTDLLAAKLDGGPAWYQRARLCGALPWPDNTIGALGTAAGLLTPGGPSDTGGTGKALAVPAAAGPLPDGFLRARRRDEHCGYTFRLVNLKSPAPTAGTQFHELPELAATADVGPITASDQLELVEFRWLAAASQMKSQVTVTGGYTQATAAARDLAPTDLVRLRYNPPGWSAAAALDTTLYVQQVSKRGERGLVRIAATLGTTLEATNLDPGQLAASQADRISKVARWGA